MEKTPPKFKLIDLSTLPEPPPPQLDYRGSATDFTKLKCTQCGNPATTIHLLPWCIQVEQIEAACATHDPGGYWFDVPESMDKLMEWLLHLGGKRGFVVGEDQEPSHASVELLRWLFGSR